jgi:hypothetical protein
MIKFVRVSANHEVIAGSQTTAKYLLPTSLNYANKRLNPSTQPDCLRLREPGATGRVIA